MKFNCKHRYFFLFLLIFLSSAFSAFAEVHGTQDLSIIYYDVGGNESRSFYPDHDIDYLYEGSVDFTKQMFGDYESFGNIMYRATDDRTIDTQDFSVERMYIGLKGKSKEILLGDFYSNFSEYSLGNAIKGGKITIGDEKTHRLIMVAGVDTTNWEDLWENRVDDSAGRRYVWGSRLENYFFNSRLSLNFNYGGARDDTAYVSPSSNPILVNVFSIDGKYKINEILSAYSEIANSYTDPDINDGSVKTKSDYAAKFGLDLNLQDYSATALYNRVGNNFNTTGGFAAQDLETMNYDAIWFLPLKVKFTHYLHTSRDNLSNTKSTTTKQLNPGGKFSFTLPAGLTADLGADMRKSYSDDKSVHEKTYTYTSSLSRDFNLCYATLGYTRTNVENWVSSSQERHSDMYSLGLDGNFTLKDVRYSWNIAEDIERIAYKEAGKADFTTSTSVGFKANFPSTLVLQLKATFGDNNYYMNETDSNTNGYYFSVSHNILRSAMKDSLLFDVTYERREYNYTNKFNNYDENILKGKLSYKF